MKAIQSGLHFILIFLFANLLFSVSVVAQSLTNVVKLNSQTITIADTDVDGIVDADDNCPINFNPTQADFDADGIGDACDNCPSKANPDQADSDGDRIGNACDNCPNISNTSQEDSDADLIGNTCDKCPDVTNVGQEDADGDWVGDACDNCRNNANYSQEDSDGDMIGDVCDNCPTVANPSQTDADMDQIGDACETLGINNQPVGNLCSIYLDPLSNTLGITGKNILKIEVFTNSGERIVQKNTNSNQVSVELANRAPGIYVVKITSKTGITVKKVLLIKK